MRYLGRIVVALVVVGCLGLLRCRLGRCRPHRRLLGHASARLPATLRQAQHPPPPRRRL